MSLFRASFFRSRLSGYQWYRRWHGGRWERHFIDICHAYIWLPMDPLRCWPQWRQPCSIGAPIVEDYPGAGSAG